MSNYAAFLRERVTDLRMKKGVSEYQMSLELGQNKNYIQGISSGKALPSMAQFFNICEYFGLSPMEFFDDGNQLPKEIHETMEKMKDLSSEDISLLSALADRFKSAE